MEMKVAVILSEAKDLHLFVIKGVLQILRFAQDDRKRFAQHDSACSYTA
jgi:hypothetical protein